MKLKYIKHLTDMTFWWKTKVFYRTESLSIAGIHTTLIAVFVACLSAYILFAYNTVQQAESKAIEEVEKINNITFLVHECPFRRLESGEALDKEKLKDMWFKITMGVDDESLPQDIDGKAQKALGIMGALVSQYPFPARIFKTKEGRFGARSAPEPISSANLDEVRDWVKEMRQIIVVFSSEFWDIPGILLPLLKEFSKSEFVSERKELFKKSPFQQMMSREVIHGLETHITWAGMEPLLVYSDFLNGLTEAMSIVRSTEIYVKRAEKLRSGYPFKLRLGILIFLVASGFGSGVVYPLVATKVRRVFALWLPLFIYVLMGFLALEIIL